MDYFSCLVVAVLGSSNSLGKPRQWLADRAMFPAQERKNTSHGTLNLSFGSPRKAFECIDDLKAAFLLFDTCRDWLTDRGMEAMDGPDQFWRK